MSENMKLSHRAVATSALALLLVGGGTLATASAGEGDKGNGGQGQSGSRGQSGGQAQAQGRPTATPSSTRRPTSPPPANPGQGQQPTENPGQGGRPTPPPGNSGGQGGGGTGGGGTGGGGTGGGTGGQGAEQDPPGNNGTFKVDGQPFDTDTSNEPHVPCGPFRLVFFGFDEGQTGDITIAGQAPSGTAVVSTRTDVLLSDDAAGGGPNDLDSIVTYQVSDLNLALLTAHPQQGYHLKVTLETDTPGGVKHKVFWLEGCETTPSVAPTTITPTTPAEIVPTTPPAIVPTTPPASVGGVRIDRPAAPDKPKTAVLGTKFARGPLAFTGSFTELLLAIGAGLLGAGAGFLAIGRRPRGAHAA